MGWQIWIGSAIVNNENRFSAHPSHVPIANDWFRHFATLYNAILWRSLLFIYEAFKASQSNHYSLVIITYDYWFLFIHCTVWCVRKTPSIVDKIYHTNAFLWSTVPQPPLTEHVTHKAHFGVLESARSRSSGSSLTRLPWSRLRRSKILSRGRW